MNPNLPPFSFPNGNASANQSSDNNNNPSQPLSNTEPTAIPQSTTLSTNPLENNNSTSISAQYEVRQREMLDTLEPSQSVARGQKVGLIAARRTGRLRGSQQNSNFEPNISPQETTLSNNPFENNNSTSVPAQDEGQRGMRTMQATIGAGQAFLQSQRFGNISANRTENSNIEPTVLPQSTTPSTNPLENNNPSSIFAQSGERGGIFRGAQTQNKFGTGRFMTQAERLAKFESRNARYFTPTVYPPIPNQGTVDFIGQSHVHPSRLDEGAGRVKFSCITGTIQGHCLDEIRAKDHFNLKQDLLSPEKKQLVRSIITRNEQLNQSEVTAQTSGSPFVNSESVLSNNNDQIKQDQNNITENSQGEKTTQTAVSAQQIHQKKTVPKKSVQPIQEVTVVEAHEEEKGEFVQQTVISSNPGSFGYEMNKMLFFSGLSQAIEKHNLTMPESILDETDFCVKFVEFLGQYQINLPTENVPQFELNSIMTLMKK